MDFTNKSDSISQSGTRSELVGLTMPAWVFKALRRLVKRNPEAGPRISCMDSAEVIGFARDELRREQ